MASARIELDLGRGDGRHLDAPLRLEQVRHVRVAVERDAVGRGRDHLVERRREAGHGLLRQAVDQVAVDRDEAVGAGGVDHEARLGLALDPVDGLLHLGVEILDPDRDPVEAEVAEEGDGVGVDLARIDLDRDLGVRRDVERAAQHAHEVGHLVAGEEGRRAAAPVQLLDGGSPLDHAADDADLAADVPDVLGAAAVVLGDDLVAGAVVADGVAERHVDVQRQRLRVQRVALVARVQRVDVVLGPEAVVKAVGGRVGRVAGAEQVVLLHQRGVEDEVGGGKGRGHRIGARERRARAGNELLPLTLQPALTEINPTGIVGGCDPRA